MLTVERNHLRKPIFFRSNLKRFFSSPEAKNISVAFVVDSITNTINVVPYFVYCQVENLEF